MSATFRVRRGFAAESRSLFVLSGEITEGMVEIGMTASLDDAAMPFSRRVHGIEFADPGAEEGAASAPALTFSYSDPAKLRRWQAIDWAGRELHLHW